MLARPGPDFDLFHPLSSSDRSSQPFIFVAEFHNNHANFELSNQKKLGAVTIKEQKGLASATFIRFLGHDASPSCVFQNEILLNFQIEISKQEGVGCSMIWLA